MTTEKIRENLLQMKDETYQKFHSSLIPSVECDNVIGVRTPLLRKFAKKISKDGDIDSFLSDLPHKYYEENQIHAFIIGEIADYDEAIEKLCRFLPYVDNWATCDQMKMKCFRKNHEKLAGDIDRLLQSKETYTVRFAIEAVMDNFLDEDLRTEFFPKIAEIRSDEYYVKMMQAWFFATALAKAWDSAVVFLENNSLDKWTHNKAVQKAVESNRITAGEKTYLRTLKR